MIWSLVSLWRISRHMVDWPTGRVNPRGCWINRPLIEPRGRDLVASSSSVDTSNPRCIERAFSEPRSGVSALLLEEPGRRLYVVTCSSRTIWRS